VTAKRCAYCGGIGPFSREHIFPQFLYRANPGTDFGYNLRRDEMVRGETTVRDVCPRCNNGPLSRLDDYAREFHDRNSCQQHFVSRRGVPVVYEHGLLSRWLLKVNYNAMRAMHSDHTLSAFVPYMLRGDSSPGSVHLFLELIRSIPLSRSEQVALGITEDLGGVPAQFLRVGALAPAPPDAIALRFVAINGYYLTQVIYPLTARDSRTAAFAWVKKRSPQAAYLAPDRSSALVRVSKRTIEDVFQQQAIAQLDAWQRYRGDA
jgi:hypothetical protein